MTLAELFLKEIVVHFQSPLKSSLSSLSFGMDITEHNFNVNKSPKTPEKCINLISEFHIHKFI